MVFFSRTTRRKLSFQKVSQRNAFRNLVDPAVQKLPQRQGLALGRHAAVHLLPFETGTEERLASVSFRIEPIDNAQDPLTAGSLRSFPVSFPAVPPC